VPLAGRVERLLWGTRDLLRGEPRPAASDRIGAEDLPSRGDFAPLAGPAPALLEPRGLAVDEADNLFVAEAGRRRVLIYNLASQRLLRAVVFAPEGAEGPSPIDLGVHGADVYVLTENPTRVFSLTAEGALSSVDLEATNGSLSRIAVSPSGRVALLDVAGKRLVFPLEKRTIPFSPEVSARITQVSDFEFQSESVAVLARAKGQSFLRLPLDGTRTRIADLDARRYDERGIVRCPDGRIGFWTDRGFREAAEPRAVHTSHGRVTTYRLDSGAWQTTWGRLFVDACVPKEANLRVHCATADEPPDEPALNRTPPPSWAKRVHHAELSPPMPPVSFEPDASEFLTLYRRDSGREQPWSSPLQERFDTYEAPIQAPPGRYLWITLELTGNTRVTPKVSCIRAEHPGHDYLKRLPRALSRDPNAAAFLQRYLALFEGFLGEVEAKSAARATLLDARVTAPELLPWLASFFGLVLDGRWSIEQQRTLVREIADLWRKRGTRASIERWLEIYLGVRPVIVESFGMRGPGGAVLGDREGATSAILGTFRVGGPIEDSAGSTSGTTVQDVFAAHAHRFTVIVPITLSEEQTDVVHTILRLHRPAHTAYDLCVAGSGMRVGLGLHIGVTTVVGRQSGFSPLSLGDWALGAEQILGQPGAGTTPGASRLGTTSEVG
jgi:phage tail-like protein